MKRLRLHFIALAGIVLFALAPLIPVLVAGLVADVNGCRLDEGSKHACVILGHDFGGILYGMGVMGWFGLLTIPAAGFLLLLWMVWVGGTLFSTLRPAKRQGS